MEDEVIIGLEVHCQLNKLNSKLFCGCSTKHHESEPNTHTCPVCMGLPGALPVINKKAVEYTIMVGLSLNCEIAEHTQFYRKNYYYPDLPRGFQITQYDYPIASEGLMTVDTDGQERAIRIRRVHMEEDPGRLVHQGSIETSKYVLVDYNRCGMPLIEVVTEPDLRSPKEARRFINKLRNILEYLDVFDGSLPGALRVDANVSLRGGARVEVKNISSYKGVERALLFEITRQQNMKRRGVKVTQETRHYDDERNCTITLRSKEQAEEYRYFPEADLVPLSVSGWQHALKEKLPELPDAKRERFRRQYGVSDNHAKVLTSEITGGQLLRVRGGEGRPGPRGDVGGGLPEGRTELPRHGRPGRLWPGQDGVHPAPVQERCHHGQGSRGGRADAAQRGRRAAGDHREERAREGRNGHHADRRRRGPQGERRSHRGLPGRQSPGVELPGRHGHEKDPGQG